MAFVAPLVPALTAIGTAVSAGGALLGGIAASNNAAYQAEVARNNATIAQNNAKYAMEAGAVKAETQSLKGAAQGGMIKAAQAANGVDVNTGSNVDVQVSQREQSFLDTQTTEHNAALQAYGYRTQAANDLAQAKIDQAESTDALIGGGLNAAGGLLGHANALSLPSLGGGGGAEPYGG